LALRSLYRKYRKNIISLLLCAVLAGFMCVYWGNLNSVKNQLDGLPEAIAVSAYVSNGDGSMRSGLIIDDTALEGIKTGGFARDFVTSVLLAANFAPETEEEKISPKRVTLAGINDISIYQGITTDVDNSVFGGAEAVCVANSAFLSRNNLKVGDTISLDLYYFDYKDAALALFYKYLGTADMTVIGAYGMSGDSGFAAVRDVLCPVEFIKNVYREYSVEYFADSASFNIVNPYELNAFKATAKELGFVSVSPGGRTTVKGNALVVDDETFIRTASSLQNNLSLLYVFLPVIFILIFLTGFISSHLMMQSCRGEYAVMRLLGTPKSMCAAVFLIESAAASFLGGCIGALIGIMARVDFTIISFAAFVCWFAFTIGTCAAVLTLARIKIISGPGGAE
jgi:hypothetical protein